MSGHSKWSNIKNKKAKADAVRGKIFTKIGREIAVAVKQGGSDIALNSKLNDIVAKAKANNMPNENIMRSIKKAAGELGSINYESLTYEGYGPAGSAIIVDALTDNKNRAAGDIRHEFDKSGGSMGSTGCVSYMFDSKGVIVIDKSKADEDKLMEDAIESGADDVIDDGDCFVVYTLPTDFSAVRGALEEKGYEFIEAERTLLPQNKITLDADALVKFYKFLDALEDLDDVQTVYHNVELPEEEDEE